MSQPLMSIINHYVPLSTGDRQQPQQIQQKPYLYRMSPTSDDKLETTTDNAYEWQQVKTTKRRNARPLEESVSPTAPENKIPKPPPIFIYGATNYNEMVNTEYRKLVSF
jgi:hypothetical protein